MREAAAEERREAGPRAPVTLRVDYKRLNTFFADYTKNISRGGTFIHTKEPLPIGTEFVFVFTVPESTHENVPVRLELTGEVKWVVPESDATAENPPGMGIQFLFKDATERDRVHQVVADLMRSSLGEHLAAKLMSR